MAQRKVIERKVIGRAGRALEVVVSAEVHQLPSGKYHVRVVEKSGRNERVVKSADGISGKDDAMGMLNVFVRGHVEAMEQDPRSGFVRVN